MLHFEWPWIALLFPLPFLIKWLFPYRKKNSPELRFPGLDRLKKAFPSYDSLGKSSNKLYFSMLFLAWSLLIITLMQPEKIDRFQQIKNKGYDLMLAVDISGSMQALDFSTTFKKVSRLDVTKEVVGKFVRGREGDRVGLVTFGENAYLHVPLTLDTIAVSKMLNDTVSGMAGNATAIGDAIGLSVRTLRNRPENSRVLVLLTDGDDNSSSIPPLEAAKLAKQYGIKIYTVGIGKSGVVPFPSQLGKFGMNDYTMAEIAMDEELLKKIAEIADGKYFHATDQNALSAIYQKINELEKSEVDERSYLIRDPLYFYPLAAAMVLLLFLALLRRTAYGA